MDTTGIREKAEQWKREHPDSLWRFASHAEILAMCDEIDRLRAILHRPDEDWKMVVCDDGYPMVCTEGDVICVVDRNHEPREEGDRRNFRLIAEAPRMRDALAFIRPILRDALKSFGPCEHDVGHCTCREQTALRLTEEALLRAGEPAPQIAEPASA